MTTAKKGDSVKVNYVGKTKSGDVFDSTESCGPLAFTLGNGSLIEGFDSAVVGMEVGEKKTVELPVDKAYGPYKEEFIHTIERAKLPDDIELQVGESLLIGPSQEEAAEFKIVSLDEETVALDGNHPLAGKDLIFEIELVSIEETKEE